VAPRGAKPEDGYGAKGGVTIRDLCLSDTADNLDVPVALASSDQCQMLCNIADQEYFVSGASAKAASARNKYLTLTLRLSFVPKMMEQLEKSNIYLLIKAYIELEANQLVFNPIPQLMVIKRRANICLERIATRMDMSGHPPE
jgi:hypothetical protein